LRVLIERGPKGKRTVALAADWPGFERNGRDVDEAVEKLVAYRPRYAKIAERAGLGTEFAAITEPEVIGDYTGPGSTDFWGISFAPSPLDRDPFDEPAFERSITLLRGAWAEFDETRQRVSPELRRGPRGGGRERDDMVRHVLAVEGQDFAKRVKVPVELNASSTQAEIDAHRETFVDAMREWYRAGTPLGNWTIPYLVRHAAYHTLDHAWEMQDRDLTPERE
jgi:hypothetical protein